MISFTRTLCLSFIILWSKLDRISRKNSNYFLNLHLLYEQISMPKGHIHIHSKSGSRYSIELPGKKILAVKWNFIFPSGLWHCLLPKDWESLYGLFVYCVRLWSHNFFSFLLREHEKNIAIKHKSINHRWRKEGITKIERAFPLWHYYNQFLFILQFSDDFFYSGLWWGRSVCGGLLFRFFGKHQLSLWLCKGRHGTKKLGEGAINSEIILNFKAWKIIRRKVNDP